MIEDCAWEGDNSGVNQDSNGCGGSINKKEISSNYLEAPTVWSTNTKTVISDRTLGAKLGNIFCSVNEAGLLSTAER